MGAAHQIANAHQVVSRRCEGEYPPCMSSSYYQFRLWKQESFLALSFLKPYSRVVNHMRRKLTTAIAVMLTLIASQVAAAESKSKIAREQTSFCEEGAPDDVVLKPVSLPTVVLTTVLNTKEGKEARELVGREGSELAPERLLKGAAVHLTDSHELFFVVMGSPPMSGVDNTWFWIVRQSGKSAIMLLFAGANCLDISRANTLGYKNIVTTWSSASTTVTEVYRYDGKSYKLWRSKSKPVSGR